MIKMAEYARRRRALMQKLSSNSIVILPAASDVLRNGDTPYPFRQNSDFYYLTGFHEPDAVLVLVPNRLEGEFILFNRIRDPQHEIWDGPRAGQAGACQDFFADQAFPINELSTILPELLQNKTTLYFPIGKHLRFDQTIMHCLNQLKAKVRSGIQPPHTFIDILPYIHEMRLFKSDEEILLMRKAAQISANAHIKAIQTCQVGQFEYQLEAELNYVFQQAGSRYPAYGSIVASGKNGCILHYIQNNNEIRDGELVLIDAGAEYQCYASDVTRTFPANGRFTGEQRAIYELVLSAQMAAIEAIKPGVSCMITQSIVVKVLTQGLIDLGILKGSLDALIEQQAYLPFYMHRASHWLGLDVHDVGTYRVNQSDWRLLQSGMVLTVEPGLYLSADIAGLPARWHNIGIRIEDDILVTENGHDILSAETPKTIADIEALMAD